MRVHNAHVGGLGELNLRCAPKIQNARFVLAAHSLDRRIAQQLPPG